MRVVGEALSPVIDDPPLIASGFLVTPGTARALRLDQGDDVFRRFVVTFDQGVSTVRGTRALEHAGFEATTPVPPPEVARLREIERFPDVLVFVLTLIGAVVVLLTMIITVRRRRRTLAVLRVLGFTRVQIIGSVVCQALVFAAVGLLVGIPLGIAVGRFAWGHVSDALGVATDAALPVGVFLLTVLAVTAVSSLAALAPARRAAHLRPAGLLRAE
jgi:predicted lysophospholipase L1 biosynthesis ABC-type transport system permease subunit